MVDRIKAAVDARVDENFVIMARTDALAVEGLDAAIERAQACVEAGADMIFPEAMTDLKMYRQFADAVKVPSMANITEFGSTRFIPKASWLKTACRWCCIRCHRSVQQAKPHWMFMKWLCAMALRPQWLTLCRPGPSCTSIWTIVPSSKTG